MSDKTSNGMLNGDWPCHAGPQSEWCDRHGPGGFMGHTCYRRAASPAPASVQEGQGWLTEPQADELANLWIHEDMDRDATEAILSLPRKELKRYFTQAREDVATWRRRALEAEAKIAAPQEQAASLCPTCEAEPARNGGPCAVCFWKSSPAASRAAVPDWPDACQWPVGKPFRVLKVGEPGDHTPWQIVMPCGGVLELNHHAEDSVDEARAKWITAALNLPQEDWSSYLKEDETPLARLQREIADNAALSSLLGKARAAVPLSREQVADMLCGPHFTEYGKRQLLNGEFAQVNLSDLTKIANIVLAAPVAQEGKAVDGDMLAVDCPVCNGKGLIGGHRGQTPDSYEEETMGCDECSGQGKIIVSRRGLAQQDSAQVDAPEGGAK